MKTLVSFITLLIFLHCTANVMISTDAQGFLPPVQDVDGDDLQIRTEYYIQSVGSVTAGLPISNRTCVFAVDLTSGDGLPVIFDNAGSIGGDGITIKKPLTIRFPGVIGCNRKWDADEYDNELEKYFVVAGGLPGPDDKPALGVNKWFGINRADDLGRYPLFYCTQIECPTCEPECKTVGVVVVNGVRRLALSEPPLLVKFKKASPKHSNC